MSIQKSNIIFPVTFFIIMIRNLLIIFLDPPSLVSNLSLLLWKIKINGRKMIISSHKYIDILQGIFLTK